VARTISSRIFRLAIQSPMITSDCSSISQLASSVRPGENTLVVVGGIDELPISIGSRSQRIHLRYHPSRSRYPSISRLHHSSFHYP
jgi:hypothetical protein